MVTANDDDTFLGPAGSPYGSVWSPFGSHVGSNRGLHVSLDHEDTVKDSPPESTWTRAIWESLTFVDLATIGEGGVSPRKMRFRVDVFCFMKAECGLHSGAARPSSTQRNRGTSAEEAEPTSLCCKTKIS